MGVLNRTTDEINTLLDKVANLPEEGTSGKDGKTPVLETGTTTTLEAGSQATSEVVRNGEDVSGNPKYKINFGIPRGQDGTSEGGGGVTDSVNWDNVQNKPTWVDSATKPTYTASEVGALPSTTSIPTKTSELQNDSNFTTTSSFKTINGNSILGEGNLVIASGGGGVADSVEWNNVLNKPQWVISDTKPTYTASEVGAIATGSLKTINGQSLEGKGNIEISGSGSGIADAPSGGKIYARINGAWVDAKELNGQTISCVPYDSMVNEVTDQPFDISELGETGDASAFMYHDFYFVGNGKLYLGTVTSMIVSEVDGKNLFTFIINFEQEDGTPSIVYLIVNLTDETYTTKIHRVSGGIPDAPANGQTYGRNNNKWVVITQGGSDSAVDITEYFTKLLSLGEGETLPLEDYNVLKGYADNNTPVKIASEPYFFKTISVALMSIGDTLFLNGIIIQQGKLYGGYIFEIKNDGTITRGIGGLPDIITFVDYQKAEKYTPITKGDTIQSAIQKLEAGIGQGGSGGGSDVYILPQALYTLTSESTSEEISTAIGGDEGFNNIVAGIKAYKRFYFNSDIPEHSISSVSEVAMSYITGEGDLEIIAMRLLSMGAFGVSGATVASSLIQKQGNTYVIMVLSSQA